MEFLTPVFFSTAPLEGSQLYSHPQIQQDKRANVTLASLLTEETLSNEEEREGSHSKAYLFFYDCQFTIDFLRLGESISNTSSAVIQNELHRVNPALLELYCIFRI
jgi:hypothetical protein